MVSIDGVRLTGTCTALPKKKIPLQALVEGLSERDVRRAVQTTGFEEFCIADESDTTADYCVLAAKNLMKKMNIGAGSIDGIVFVSQTPDFRAPATSALLQDRLGISKTVPVFDINHGCPGFVYGLFQAAMMIKAGMSRVLVCVGDTVTRYANPKDRSARLIFGDAGSASFVEVDADSKMDFSFYTDGSGAPYLCMPGGGSRYPWNVEMFTPEEDEHGNWRNKCEIYMDGGEIMAFSLAVVPVFLADFMKALNVSEEDIGFFALHQANKLIIETIARKLRISSEKMPFGAAHFGNTSSASIPLLLSTNYKAAENAFNKEKTVILCGFGVGLTVASVALSLKNTLITELLEI